MKCIFPSLAGPENNFNAGTANKEVTVFLKVDLFCLVCGLSGEKNYAY